MKRLPEYNYAIYTIEYDCYKMLKIYNQCFTFRDWESSFLRFEKFKVILI